MTHVLARLSATGRLLASVVVALVLTAGCASQSLQNGQKLATSTGEDNWMGRISLQIQGTAEGASPQAFSASFELAGQPDLGELTLISPLGNILGVLRWTPQEALWDTGSGTAQRFASVNAFMEQTTGAAVPITALFSWLRGDNTAIPGWTADLSRRAEGRINAQRTQPAPQVDLRVVLEQ